MGAAGAAAGLAGAKSMTVRPPANGGEGAHPSIQPARVPDARPRVSVIIPFHNEAATLGGALDSVAAQTVPDWEAVLVDDASTDAGTELAAARAAADPRFRLLRLPQNGGVAAARNAGIAAARGRFIAFLDADDLWLPQKLARQLPVLEGGVPLVCSAYARINPAGENLGVVRPPLRFGHAQALNGNPVGCLTAIWDRDRFPHARMPDIPLHEDYAFWLSLLRNGDTGHGLQEVLAHYRVSPGSRSGRKWRAAQATWHILRGEPGVGPLRALWGFMIYGARAVSTRARKG